MPARLLSHGGWPCCVQLENGACELLVTTDVGPRILRAALTGGGNLLYQVPEDAGQTGGDTWRLYGGHRLWHAPEHPTRTYAPDNAPVPFELGGDRVLLKPATELSTGVQKELEIVLHPSEPRATITHRLFNRGPWPITAACWALTALGAGARAAIPQAPRRPHPKALLPERTLALWAYTDMADPRWRWGARTIQLRQDPARPSPQKLGARNHRGCVAGWRAGTLLIKRFIDLPGAVYPDLGCNIELFTDGHMLEIETLGPLVTIPPGGQIEHVEFWELREMPVWPEDEDALVDGLGWSHISGADGL